MKHYLFGIILITTLFILIFSGCEKERQRESKTTTQNSADDTSSVIIKYDVTGSGSGMITLTKKDNKIKLELTKFVNGKSNIETRFISDGWIYFYFMTETGVQPVKSKINKDHNYFKNFAALADPDEVILRMKKGGNEIVAGFTCDMYESNGTKFLIYNNKYVLQASYDGIVITAKSLSFNAAVQNQEVEKPTSIEFLELTSGPL